MKNLTCPVFRAARIAGSKRSLGIIQEIHLSKGSRFNTLKRTCRISPKVLSKKLRDMENEGILKRTRKPGSKNSEYYLTERGTEFLKILDALKEWTSYYENLGCKTRRCTACPLF
ncbi:MAG: helix-turn-helix transcriptional regulator [Candidatus Aenigmarchaeota archaeon]|nr:helix-turn-helix transcriptional regulator [Candidatus Aenigmarchaeota archaeon]